MQHFAPIALFVYNRPEHTRRTLKFLGENQLASESRLFIFSDAAATEKEAAQVNAVREVIRFGHEQFKSVTLVEQPHNLGLATSVIRGVTQLVSEYGQVIVVEDDLVTSPATLLYFNTALEKYRHTPEVMHIGAYMYPLADDTLPETFFYRAATSWGWATWERAWSAFDPDIERLLARFDREKIHAFSIEGTMNFWKQMLDFRAGKNNSWAIRWYASIFLAGGLTLNPSKSLVNNIGHDGSGTHSGNNSIYNVTVSERPVDYFPDQLEENKAAYRAIKRFLRHRKGSWLQRVVRFVRERW